MGDRGAGGVPVVLASVSPRRRELLKLLGLGCEVVPAQVDESVKDGEAPEAMAERLARAKASAIRRPLAAVVGADTVVVVDGAILGKPADVGEAMAMLRRLGGREHTVHTGVAVAYQGRLASGVVSAKVRFRPLDPRTIADYVATGEPLDKAGAYGIQGRGAVLVERVEGDYFTVMGLGLVKLVELLREVGLSYRFGELTPES